MYPIIRDSARKGFIKTYIHVCTYHIIRDCVGNRPVHKFMYPIIRDSVGR
jgi:hypothetical protein